MIAAKRADALSRDLAQHDYQTNLEAVEIIKQIRQLTFGIRKATTDKE